MPKAKKIQKRWWQLYVLINYFEGELDIQCNFDLWMLSLAKILETEKLWSMRWFVNKVPSLKLTWHLKMDGWKMYFLLNMGIFHCHVSLPEGKGMNLHSITYRFSSVVESYVLQQRSSKSQQLGICWRWESEKSLTLQQKQLQNDVYLSQKKRWKAWRCIWISPEKGMTDDSIGAPLANVRLLKYCSTTSPKVYSLPPDSCWKNNHWPVLPCQMADVSPVPGWSLLVAFRGMRQRFGHRRKLRLWVFWGVGNGFPMFLF